MKKTNTKNKAAPKTRSKITHPKLLVFLFILLSIPIAIFAHNRYKDWDNAQLIKGLAKDFPLLVKDIEQATGLDLEIKNDCMTTTEKFGTGVRTCELSIAKATEREKIDKAIEAMKTSPVPTTVQLSDTERTYKIKYRNKNACSISNGETIYLTCITAVRERNIDLARDVLSKDLD